MNTDLKTKLYWISVGSPTAWGDVQKVAGEALANGEQAEAELDATLAALDIANAEIVKLKAQNESLRGLCVREHIASAVAALEVAE